MHATLALFSALKAAISVATVLTILIAVVDIGFLIAFLYVGALLPALLRSAVDRIVTLLYVSAGWLVVGSVPGPFVGDRLWVLVDLAVGLLIVWYLLRNARRLAGEAPNVTAAQGSNPA